MLTRRIASRRMLSARLWLSLGCLAVVAVPACSSSSAKTAPTSTSKASVHVRATLTFRPIRETGAFSPRIFPARSASCSAASTPAGDEILFDRRHERCYVVGPVLLTGSGVENAAVVYDQTMSQWAVNLHWGNDDFVTKIARPLIARTVAIDVDDVVQSAPVINPGVTGRDIQISSAYTRAEAVKVAASIMGVAPTDIEVNSER